MSGMQPTDKEIDRAERLMLSRRRMIRDVCAATGWVFVSGARVAYSTDPIVTGDPKNSSKEWGKIKGRVIYEGTIPAQKEIELDKAGLPANDLTWFKSMGPVLNQEWVIQPKSKGIQWVYVWLLPEDSKGVIKVHRALKEIPAERKKILVDQEPSGYVPHTVGLQIGQGIVMRNQGPVQHVFNFAGFANAPFNRVMPPGSEVSVDEFKLERAALQINCPPHPWERMWLRTFSHPYFAVTGVDGAFEIPLAPAGKGRLVVWHEQAGFLGGKTGRDGSIIDVSGAAITDLGDIKLSAKTT